MVSRQSSATEPYPQLPPSSNSLWRELAGGRDDISSAFRSSKDCAGKENPKMHGSFRKVLPHKYNSQVGGWTSPEIQQTHCLGMVLKRQSGAMPF